MFYKLMIKGLLLVDFCSPNNLATIAVKTKLSEFATGTARDKSVFCRVKKYKTLPDWFKINGIKY